MLYIYTLVCEMDQYLQNLLSNLVCEEKELQNITKYGIVTLRLSEGACPKRSSFMQELNINLEGKGGIGAFI